MRYQGICMVCGNNFQRTLNPSAIARGKGKFCSRVCYALELSNRPSWNKGLHHTEEHKQHLKENHKGNTGRKFSEEHRLKISISRKGEKAWNWKGGVTHVLKRLRKSREFKEWRKLVFERDNYMCQECGKRGGELHPDHIKQFADFPELRFEVSNGRTLCAPCHRKTSTWGARKNRI